MALTRAACLLIPSRWIQQSSILPDFGAAISGDRRTHQAHANASTLRFRGSRFRTRSSRESTRTRTAKMLTMDHGKKPSMLAAATLSVRPSHYPNFSGSISRRSMNGSAWPLRGVWRMLVLTSMKPRLIHQIATRGEYVEFGLPHHCHSGEKYWVSRNGKTRVLINVV